ncbi:MAG: peptidylprolyl isomerase, partial [Kiritimatiellae bacterium]|nr:peptidylprolyl isomerase [Kiritimatiellia bacterium]
AMLSGKFHKIIQSRLVWGIFAVLIILSFVVWGSAPYWANSKDSAESRVAGTLSGRDITDAELRDAESHVYLTVALGSGGAPRDLPADMVREAAVRRLVLLDEARRMGVRADEAQVLEEIRNIPMFQQGGQFNSTAYAQFVRGFLRAQLGYSERFFLDHIGQEMVIRRLRTMAAESALVPPADGDRMFAVLKDQLKIEIAVLDPALFESSVDVTDAAVAEFFERDPSRYTLPARMEVEVASFDPARFTDNLPALTDGDIEDYYQDNIRDYTTLTAAPESPDGTPQAPRRVTQPLEEVRDQVVERMKLGFATDRAEAAATRLVGLIAGDQGTPVPFEEAAERMQVEVRRLPPFAAGEPIEGMPNASSEFYESAMALTSAAGGNFSTPVRSGGGVHVLRLIRRVPPRVPELAEVAERVRADARAEALQEALRSKADELRAAGGNFAQTAEGMGFKLEKPEPFTLEAGLRDSEFGQAAMSAIVYINAGEISEPVPVSGGRWVVVRVLERKPSTEADRMASSAELMRRLSMERQREMANLWEDSLVKSRWVSAAPPLEEDEQDDMTDEQDPLEAPEEA